MTDFLVYICRNFSMFSADWYVLIPLSVQERTKRQKSEQLFSGP